MIFLIVIVLLVNTIYQVTYVTFWGGGFMKKYLDDYFEKREQLSRVR